MSKIFKLLVVLAIIPAISGCTKYTSIRQHKEFSNIFPKYNKVAIIPSYIFINQQTKDGARQTKPNPERINKIAQIAQQDLTKKGYIVTEIISDDDTESNDKFNDSYKTSVGKLYKGLESGQQDNALATSENMGTITKNISPKSQADLLLVLGYEGSEMAQEQITKNFAKDVAWAMIGVHNNTHVKDGSAVIGLVERQSGNLLWTNLGSDFEDYNSSVMRLITRNNVMETAFERALKGLPDKTKAVN